MNDRFKFRVWDNKANMYINNTLFLMLSNGTLVQDIKRDLIVEYCTGIKDSCGTLIYEGDMIEHPYYGVCNIVWRNGSFKLRHHKKGSNSYQGLYTNAKQSEVIGNIHKEELVCCFKGGE